MTVQLAQDRYDPNHKSGAHRAGSNIIAATSIAAADFHSRAGGAAADHTAAAEHTAAAAAADVVSASGAPQRCVARAWNSTAHLDADAGFHRRAGGAGTYRTAADGIAVDKPSAGRNLESHLEHGQNRGQDNASFF
jgi:hypothetical protein